MADEDESIMIALLPTETSWCSIDLPHVTLVYAGEIKDRKITDFNALAKDAAVIAQLTTPLILQVSGIEQFGPEGEKVDVLTLKPTPELMAIRNMVEGWNASEYDFTPHATIGPHVDNPNPNYVTRDDDNYYPRYLVFNRIMVAWGKETMTFWLKSVSYS